MNEEILERIEKSLIKLGDEVQELRIKYAQLEVLLFELKKVYEERVKSEQGKPFKVVTLVVSILTGVGIISAAIIWLANWVKGILSQGVK